MAPTGELGVIGSGSMGRGMALLYSEKGNKVHLYDVNQEAVKSVLQEAKETRTVPEDHIIGHASIDELTKAFEKGKPRIIIMSLPHGETIDKVLDQLEPDLNKGDIVIDGANEFYLDTERRQKRLKEKGVAWIGTGVSGGYQASRRGPSMSPGGDEEAYKIVEPLLRDWAAKAKDGEPCVRWVGPGGAGHYVKMVHNGIEQGELSVLAETYGILRNTLGISNDEIKEIFTSWNEKGELSDNFLVDLGALITGFKEGGGIKNENGILNDIADKITQDVDNSEGTGVWTVQEAAARHVAAPTIATAHFLRVVSSNYNERSKTIEYLKISRPTQHEARKNKEKWIETLRLATYGGFLCSFIQGLNIITRASADFKWKVPMASVLQIWREGCIIKSGYIADLIQPIYEAQPDLINLLTVEKICSELNKTFEPLKEVVKLAIDADAVVPAISASLEYMKAVGSDDPTHFEESQLDAFGDHMFSLKGESGDPKKGSHHVEWRKA